MTNPSGLSIRDREMDKFTSGVGGDTTVRVQDSSFSASTSSSDITDVSPALLQSINTTNLDAVGSTTGSNVGAWTNMSNFGNKTVYYEYSSGTAGGIVVNLEASPDAGSTAFIIGSREFTDTTSTVFDINGDHHEFLRTITTLNSGGTLTTTITGRGGD